MNIYYTLFIVVFLFTASPLNAQSFKSPDRAHLSQAKEVILDSVFTRLNPEEADELAEWMVDQVHSDASGSNRVQQINQFQSQFRMIVQDGPDSPFGEMDGYDLLDETALPGTDRYFRLTYMTYHNRAPLVWEFHFYVTPTDELSLAFVNFEGQNPFSYMTTPDMLIQQFYNRY